MNRGVLEATRLQKTFQKLREKGPVETLDDVMKWPIISAAVKEGVVRSSQDVVPPILCEDRLFGVAVLPYYCLVVFFEPGAMSRGYPLPCVFSSATYM